MERALPNFFLSLNMVMPDKRVTLFGVLAAVVLREVCLVIYRKRAPGKEGLKEKEGSQKQ